jgi:hypothetical protein
MAGPPGERDRGRTSLYRRATRVVGDARLTRAARHPIAAGIALFTVLALALTGPALLGLAALGPDAALDVDPLYSQGPRPRLPRFNDFTPICLDLPRDLAFARGLHAGRVDHWNPLTGAGAPLWAEQGGPFFPLKLPFYLAPSPWTYDVFRALRLIAAGLGAFLLARRRGLPLVPALAAGALFEVSGILVAQLAFGASSPTYVLPWALLGAEAIAAGGGGRSIAGAALALGVAASAGHPSLGIIVLTGFSVAIAGHALVRWRRPTRAAAIAACGLLAFVFGLALAAPTVLPLVELLGVGRSYKGTVTGAAFQNLALDQAQRMLPVALFAPATLDLMRTELRAVFPSALAPSLGVVALVAAVAGILRGGLDVPLGGVALLGVIVATAPSGFSWIATLPGLSYLTPTYAWPLVTLPLTQAAGRGVGVLAARDERTVAAGALAVVLAGAASLFLVADSHIRFPLHLEYGTVLRDVLARPEGMVRLAGPLLLAAIAATIPARRGWPVGLVATTAIVEMVLVMSAFTRLPRSAVLDGERPGVVELLRNRLADGSGRMVGIPATVGAPMTPALFGIPDVRGVSALPLQRYHLYLHAITPGVNPFTVQKIAVEASPLHDVAAVRYVVVARQWNARWARFLGDDVEMPLLAAAAEAAVYENRAALPRVRVVHRASVAPDMDAARDLVIAARGRARHARQASFVDEIVVEPDAAGSLPPSLDGPPGNDRVRVVAADDPDELVIEASLDDHGFLVVADSYYPGWEARLDGVPVPIYPANLLFRAVAVPPGTHTVSFRLRPRAFRIGVALFALAAVASLALAARASRQPCGPRSSLA